MIRFTSMYHQCFCLHQNLPMNLTKYNLKLYVFDGVAYNEELYKFSKFD